MTERLTLDIESSAVEVDFKNDGETVGVIKLNPTDYDIVNRYEKTVDAINNITVSDDCTVEEFFEICDAIKKQIDYLFNYNVSDVIFSKSNPLSVTADGSFYVENVLNGVINLVEKVTDQRIAKKEAKIRKATAKYTKDHSKKVK